MGERGGSLTNETNESELTEVSVEVDPIIVFLDPLVDCRLLGLIPGDFNGSSFCRGYKERKKK